MNGTVADVIAGAWPGTGVKTILGGKVIRLS